LQCSVIRRRIEASVSISLQKVAFFHSSKQI
jgi:hypothetical protein